MKTTEAIEFFKTHDVTETQGYNILISDIWQIGVTTKYPSEDQPGESHTITPEDMANPVAQALIQFFMYQIQAVLLPVIKDLRSQDQTDAKHE